MENDQNFPFPDSQNQDWTFIKDPIKKSPKNDGEQSELCTDFTLGETLNHYPEAFQEPDESQRFFTLEFTKDEAADFTSPSRDVKTQTQIQLVEENETSLSNAQITGERIAIKVEEVDVGEDDENGGVIIPSKYNFQKSQHFNPSPLMEFSDFTPSPNDAISPLAKAELQNIENKELQKTDSKSQGKNPSQKSHSSDGSRTINFSSGTTNSQKDDEKFVGKSPEKNSQKGYSVNSPSMHFSSSANSEDVIPPSYEEKNPKSPFREPKNVCADSQNDQDDDTWHEVASQGKVENSQAPVVNTCDSLLTDDESRNGLEFSALSEYESANSNEFAQESQNGKKVSLKKKTSSSSNDKSWNKTVTPDSKNEKTPKTPISASNSKEVLKKTKSKLVKVQKSTCESEDEFLTTFTVKKSSSKEKLREKTTTSDSKNKSPGSSSKETPKKSASRPAARKPKSKDFISNSENDSVSSSSVSQEIIATSDSKKEIFKLENLKDKIKVSGSDSENEHFMSASKSPEKNGIKLVAIKKLKSKDESTSSSPETSKWKNLKDKIIVSGSDSENEYSMNISKSPERNGSELAEPEKIKSENECNSSRETLVSRNSSPKRNSNDKIIVSGSDSENENFVSANSPNINESPFIAAKRKSENESSTSSETLKLKNSSPKRKSTDLSDSDSEYALPGPKSKKKLAKKKRLAENSEEEASSNEKSREKIEKKETPKKTASFARKSRRSIFESTDDFCVTSKNHSSDSDCQIIEIIPGPSTSKKSPKRKSGRFHNSSESEDFAMTSKRQKPSTSSILRSFLTNGKSQETSTYQTAASRVSTPENSSSNQISLRRTCITSMKLTKYGNCVVIQFGDHTAFVLSNHPKEHTKNFVTRASFHFSCMEEDDWKYFNCDQRFEKDSTTDLALKSMAKIVKKNVCDYSAFESMASYLWDYLEN